MFVTCFGYTGYRNAKFGQIQVHERITGISRELLMQIKGLAEDMGFEVLHGIVDCLWVIGEPISAYKEAVERETGILTEVDSYNWIAFLPMDDASGAYNPYFGRLNIELMDGFVTSADPECICSWAVPIPVISKTILEEIARPDRDIALPVNDVCSRTVIGQADYGDVWTDVDLEVKFEPENCSGCNPCLVEEACPMRAVKSEAGRMCMDEALSHISH